MISQHLYLVILWVLFCIQHSVLAGEWWKSKMRLLLRNRFRFYRLYYSVFAMLNMLFLLYFQYTIESVAIWETFELLNFIGLLSGTTGIIVMILCIRKYFFQLSGVSVFSGADHSAPILQTHGIHNFVRHPLYFGTLLFIWSCFLLFPFWSNLAACVLISIYTIAGIRIEERKLIQEFGEKYKMYAEKVPMLIPGVFMQWTKLRRQFSGNNIT